VVKQEKDGQDAAQEKDAHSDQTEHEQKKVLLHEAQSRISEDLTTGNGEGGGQEDDSLVPSTK